MAEYKNVDWNAILADPSAPLATRAAASLITSLGLVGALTYDTRDVPLSPAQLDAMFDIIAKAGCSVEHDGHRVHIKRL